MTTLPAHQSIRAPPKRASPLSTLLISSAIPSPHFLVSAQEGGVSQGSHKPALDASLICGTNPHAPESQAPPPTKLPPSHSQDRSQIEERPKHPAYSALDTPPTPPSHFQSPKSPPFVVSAQEAGGVSQGSHKPALEASLICGTHPSTPDPEQATLTEAPPGILSGHPPQSAQPNQNSFLNPAPSPYF